MNAPAAGRGQPALTIGLPVYNGEDYLAAALDSLLAQTYTDFQLLVSDNASTDGTAAICTRYAASDSRVRYLPLQSNIGGIANHNRLFAMAAGRYFMLAAHDDIWRPDYLQRCVLALEDDPGVVLAYSRMAIIDESSRVYRVLELEDHTDSHEVARRFHQLVQIHSTLESVYGVMRTSALRQTRFFIRHPGSDRVLLCELGLRGRFARIPEHLYLRRVHKQGSTQAYPSIYERYGWVAPSLAGKRVYPHFGYLRAFSLALLNAPLRFRDRLSCLTELLRWVRYNWKDLARDLKPTAG